jgi:hypothetical protein
MAFAAGNTVVPGYPMQIGDKYMVMFDHTGPASYTQYTTAGAGGDTINGSDLGFGGFDFVDMDVDTTGQIAAYPLITGKGYGNAGASVQVVYYALVTATLGGKSQTLGTQIAAGTVLSTFSWRVKAEMV